MTTTATTKIAKAMMLTGLAPTGHFFNDRLLCGTRSLKVWGWKPEHYAKAAELLTAAGHQAVVVHRNVRSIYTGKAFVRTRLWVVER